MTRYAMVADLERCVGCQTCTAACRHANATSPMVQWRKVLDVETGSYPNVERVFVPVGCQHCADPPCMHVCPTTATRKRPDGIVTVDYDLCIGCAYCEMACPYDARFKVSSPRYAYGDSATASEAARDDSRRIGVSQKCTFCHERIDFGLAHGLVPGVDPEATPACVNSCIADALQFGDLHDPESRVSGLLREQSHFRMHEDLGTDPGFYYLHDKRHAGPWPAGEAAPDPDPRAGAGHATGHVLAPRLQREWNWKAAANFLCGGAGSSLFAFTTAGAFDGAPFVSPGLVSLGIVALGLLVLMFKIGRPLRFINVLKQPLRSWMSREAWIAAVFFPLALISLAMPSPRLGIAAAVFGLLFLFAQAMILKESRGIPAWRAPGIFTLTVATGLAEGAGLYVAALALAPAAIASWAVAALAALSVLRQIAWGAYLNGLRTEGAPAQTLAVIGRYRAAFLAAGLAVPLLLIALGFALPVLARASFAIAGLAVLAAGWTLKFILVTRAAYNQGYAIERRRPHRSGDVALTIRAGWNVPGMQ